MQKGREVVKMITFKNILKKSFLEGFSGGELSTSQILIVLLLTVMLGIYIFVCYRVFTRKTFYSKNFNISLVAIAIITAGVILTIQSSVVISLGMVGALSIVRFRTAIKDPMDLIFLFWALCVGIICGAGLAKIAVVVSLALTIIMLILNKLPVAKAPKILVINAGYSKEIDNEIHEALRRHTKYFEEKTRRLNGDSVNLIFEMRIHDGRELVDDLREIPGLVTVSLLSHDGEVTF